MGEFGARRRGQGPRFARPSLDCERRSLGSRQARGWRARKRPEARAPPSGTRSWAPARAGAVRAGGGRGLCAARRRVSEMGAAGRRWPAPEEAQGLPWGPGRAADRPARVCVEALWPLWAGMGRSGGGGGAERRGGVPAGVLAAAEVFGVPGFRGEGLAGRSLQRREPACVRRPLL